MEASRSEEDISDDDEFHIPLELEEECRETFEVDHGENTQTQSPQQGFGPGIGQALQQDDTVLQWKCKSGKRSHEAMSICLNRPHPPQIVYLVWDRIMESDEDMAHLEDKFNARPATRLHHTQEFRHDIRELTFTSEEAPRDCIRWQLHFDYLGVNFGHIDFYIGDARENFEKRCPAAKMLPLNEYFGLLCRPTAREMDLSLAETAPEVTLVFSLRIWKRDVYEEEEIHEIWRDWKQSGNRFRSWRY